MSSRGFSLRESSVTQTVFPFSIQQRFSSQIIIQPKMKPVFKVIIFINLPIIFSNFNA